MTRRLFIGTTVEGLPCEFAADYANGAPVRIVGSYFAHDSRDADGRRALSYFDVERVEDLPHVVSNGTWEPQDQGSGNG